MKEKKATLNLSSLSKKSRLLMVFALILGMITFPINNYATLVSAQALDYAGKGNLEQMARCLFLCLVIFFVSSIQPIAWEWFRQKLYADEYISVKDSMLQSMFRRPSRLFRRENDAYYLNLFNTDTQNYISYLGCVMLLCNWSMAILSGSFFLFRMSPALCVTALLAAGLPFLANKPFEKMTTKAKNDHSKVAEAYNGVLKETLEGYEAIRADSHIQAAMDRFHESCEKAHRARAWFNVADQISQTFFFGVADLSDLICIALGGWLILRGELSVAMMIAARVYFVQVANAVGNVQSYVINIRSTRDLRAKLAKEVNEPADVGTAEVDPAVPATVAYEGLSFGFGERKLYDGLSCSFAPGGCYAILGESGSGKSTLTKLLLKYYDDYGGKITLAGQDIRNLSEEEIYRVVGLVSQSPFLFNSSLYENITMFTSDPPRDSAEYEKLLADLNLTALAQRVGDAPLGDFGDNISGGERQRINIARALRSHPAILIFDEPTTGLDPENVALIDQFIFERKDVTRIVITHNWAEEYLSRFDAVLRIGEKAAAA
ncbi:MAG: ABC transporter ATP-binding protein [Oscillospiraceae bacterium]|nr:ABC transporter ATP-binding protein [Oscillospiraceae bacterium]MBP3521818.1 ABC transporter ATP-binding protein [Oscillospiraceae bacterium]